MCLFSQLDLQFRLSCDSTIIVIMNTFKFNPFLGIGCRDDGKRQNESKNVDVKNIGDVQQSI